MDGTRKHQEKQILTLSPDVWCGITGESDDGLSTIEGSSEGACSSVVGAVLLPSENETPKGLNDVPGHLLGALLRWARDRDARRLRRSLLALLQVLDEAA